MDLDDCFLHRIEIGKRRQTDCLIFSKAVVWEENQWKSVPLLSKLIRGSDKADRFGMKRAMYVAIPRNDWKFGASCATWMALVASTFSGSWCTYFDRHKTSMKKTWEGINDVRLTSRKEDQNLQLFLRTLLLATKSWNTVSWYSW